MFKHNHPNPVPALKAIEHDKEAEIFLQLEGLSLEERQLKVQEHILRSVLRGNHLQLENLQVNQAVLGFLSDIDTRFHRTKSISLHFTGASMQSNDLVLNVGQTSAVSITPLLADGTPSNGVVSNANYAFTDASATVAPSADRATALITGVAPSTNGAVTGTASATVTDTDGAVSQWTQTFTILVNGTITPPPPEQLTQSVRVDFTDPV